MILYYVLMNVKQTITFKNRGNFKFVNEPKKARKRLTHQANCLTRDQFETHTGVHRVGVKVQVYKGSVILSVPDTATNMCR